MFHQTAICELEADLSMGRTGASWDDSGVIGLDVWSSPSVLCSEDLSMFVVCHPDTWWKLILLLSVSRKIYKINQGILIVFKFGTLGLRVFAIKISY
ncbi:hypothetical protein BS47DRAFT_1340836 [Hydnum rufescens UP504]|uniref:Uncharacterized protein n=1 Tax=Hydnum rufescens UP504 TaxID=1448309 RepID=A0A9P6DVJ9_9AGAM|nr:hypothetical protein BS47DRAFT_1340836 [Hydnum rufescens UP504]